MSMKNNVNVRHLRPRSIDGVDIKAIGIGAAYYKEKFSYVRE